MLSKDISAFLVSTHLHSRKKIGNLTIWLLLVCAQFEMVLPLSVFSHIINECSASYSVTLFSYKHSCKHWILFTGT
jgi:hypothetical protein